MGGGLDAPKDITEIAGALKDKGNSVETTSSLLQTNRTKIIVAIVVISIIAVLLAAYKLYRPKPEVLTEPLTNVLSEPLPKMLPEVLPEVLSEPLPVEQSKWYQSIPVWAFIGGALIIVGVVSYFAYSKLRVDPIKYIYEHAERFNLESKDYKYVEGMDYYDVNVLKNFEISSISSAPDHKLKALATVVDCKIRLAAPFDKHGTHYVQGRLSDSLIEKFNLSRAKLSVAGTAFHIMDN